MKLDGVSLEWNGMGWKSLDRTLFFVVVSGVMVDYITS
jgi:hypothetical protein